MAIDRELQDVIRKHVENAVTGAAAEVAAVLQARIAGAIGLGRGRGRPRLAGRVARRAGGGAQIRACIAPNCKNQSKGPRFHYLCEEHRSEPKAKWSKWAEAAKKKSKKATKAG